MPNLHFYTDEEKKTAERILWCWKHFKHLFSCFCIVFVVINSINIGVNWDGVVGLNDVLRLGIMGLALTIGLKLI